MYLAQKKRNLINRVITRILGILTFYILRITSKNPEAEFSIHKTFLIKKFTQLNTKK